MTPKAIIDPNKNAYENAAVYFEKAKKLRKKLEDTKKAIANTEKELAEAKKVEEKKAAKSTGLIEKKKKEWYAQFHWFITSDGLLAVGGKNADQNELLVKKYFEKDDLFFHADIQGGSVVILKQGRNADEKSKNEAAQFAGCFSNAWKVGYAAIDVYAATRDQVSKSPPSGEYLEKGSFFISGEKEYFNSTQLSMLIGKTVECILGLPTLCGRARFSKVFEIMPGGKEKEMVAKKLADEFGVKKDELLPLIPGNSAVRQK